MAKKLKIYYLDNETKELVGEKLLSLDENIEILGRYYLHLIDEKVTYQSHEYYPLFAYHAGKVTKGYQNGENYIILISGYYMADEVDDTWIFYCVKENPVNLGETYDYMAVMSTDTGECRIKVGSNPQDFNSVIEKTDTIDFFSISIDTGSMSESYMTYGSTYSPSCNIEMSLTSDINVGNYIRIEFKIDGIWVNFGVFYIDEPPEMTSEYTNIHGIGMLESALSRKWNSLWDNGDGTYTSKWYVSKTPDRILNEFGVKVVFSMLENKADEIIDYWNRILFEFPREVAETKTVEFPDGSEREYIISWSEKYPETPRDFLSALAIGLQANVIERNGIVFLETAIPQETTFSIADIDGFNPWKFTLLFDDSTYEEEPVQKLIGNYFSPNPVKVNVTPMTSINTSDSSNGIKIPVLQDVDNIKVDISNPTNPSGIPIINYPVEISGDNVWWINNGLISRAWEDAGILPSFLDNLAYFTRSLGINEHSMLYYPVNIEFIGFNPFVYSGSRIRVKIDGITRYVYVGNVNFSWDGMFSMSVSTPCDISITNNASSSSSTGGSSSSAGVGQVPATFFNAVQTGVIIQDSVIKGSQINFSTFGDGVIKGSMIDGSTFQNGQISGSAIDTSTFTDGSITGSKIRDSTITGSKIADSTITGAKIEDSTLSGSKLRDGTIENSKIKDGTIEGSKIANATLTGAKIKDAEIGFEKVNTSFITDLTANSAYVENLKANVANINELTADDAIIKNIQTVALNADYIKTAVADVGYITADDADLAYAKITLGNIDVANIDKAKIGMLFAEVGLITDATIVEGHVTGYLDAVNINANNIKAGTLSVDRLVINGSEESIIYALNNAGDLTSTSVDTLDGELITERTITADHIVAGTITGNEIHSQSITADKMIISSLSAISANLGTVTAGVIQSTNYVPGGSGMQINLATGVLDSSGFSIDSDGSFIATSGQIGGFNVWSDSIITTATNGEYSYTVLLNTNQNTIPFNASETYNGEAVALEVRKDTTSATESGWYVTYDGYMFAEKGDIAGLNVSENGLLLTSVTQDGSVSVDSTLTINSKQTTYGGDILTLHINKVSGSSTTYGDYLKITNTGEIKIIDASITDAKITNLTIGQIGTQHLDISSNGIQSYSGSTGTALNLNANYGDVVVGSGSVGNFYVGDYVRIYSSSEGGNIRLTAPSSYDVYWEQDAYNGNLRFYRYSASASPSGVYTALILGKDGNANTRNILPMSNNTYSLGTSSNLWANIYTSSMKVSKSSFAPLTIERTGTSTYGAAIKFANASGTLGYIGMTTSADDGLTRWGTDTTKFYKILDEQNYTTYVGLKAYTIASGETVMFNVSKVVAQSSYINFAYPVLLYQPSTGLWLINALYGGSLRYNLITSVYAGGTPTTPSLSSSTYDSSTLTATITPSAQAVLLYCPSGITIS